MKHVYFSCLLAFLAMTVAQATSKPHIITFGKVLSVKGTAGPDESQAEEMKVRGLYVDGRVKEFAIGAAHEITDHLFVVRRALRLNDSLPEEANGPRWIWKVDGWLLVDRVTGRISSISLPQFDPLTSVASWYRDYAAYCGVSDDGQKVYTVVAQLGRRKPILIMPLGNTKNAEPAEHACPAPNWQRQPPRVTFAPNRNQKFTYAVRGHAADVVIDEPDE